MDLAFAWRFIRVLFSGRRVRHQVQFIGEQDGPSERLLTAKLHQFVSNVGTVQSAYLCRAQLGQDEPIGVVLAIRADEGSNRAVIAAAAGEVFKQIFASSQKLDILFLDAEHTASIARVCQPFFERT